MFQPGFLLELDWLDCASGFFAHASGFVGPNYVTFHVLKLRYVCTYVTSLLRVVLYETRVCNANVTLTQFIFPCGAGLWGSRIRQRA